MYRVVSCLVTEHDTWLVLLAVIVCVATALTSFLMYSIADACSGPRKLLWAALTGVSAGSGIWATHFVAMLAYKGALPTHYEPVATIGSLLIAIVLAAVGFAVSTGRNRWWMALGGILIGFAIGTMHFTGMTALVIPGTIEWDSNFVVASWVLGCAIAATAMLAFHGRSGTQAIVCAGALLAAAICVLHFTAMGAVTIHFDPTVAFEGIGMNRAHLALVIAAVTFIVLLSAFAAAIVQRANLHYEAALQQQNSLFEAALRYLPVGFSMFDGEQRLIMCNPAYRQLYCLAEEATRGGTHFSDIVSKLMQKKAHDGTPFSVAQHLLKLGCGTTFTETVLLDDGRSILKKVGPIAGGGWVDVQEDITERLEQNAKIVYMAQHDILTGLPNPHGAPQSRSAYRARRSRLEVGTPRRQGLRAVHRSRSLQERERHARPPHWRRDSQGGGRPSARQCPQTGPRRAPRRRRIRRPADHAPTLASSHGTGFAHNCFAERSLRSARPSLADRRQRRNSRIARWSGR